MRIDVTDEDIANGERRCAVGCPVALATLRASGAAHVFVGGDLIALIYPDRPYPVKHRTPPAVAEFVMSFDEHELVRSFSFDLP